MNIHLLITNHIRKSKVNLVINEKEILFWGTSITKGGGLEDVEYRDDIRPLYRKMGVYVPKQEECS